MTDFQRMLILLLAALGGTTYSQTNNTDSNVDCDIGPDALTELARGLLFPGSTIEIPQTCLEFGGLERCYYTYVPDNCAGQLPLLVVSHGSGSCSWENAAIDGWLQKAAAKCMVVIYPLGITDPDVADTSCFNVAGGIDYDDGKSTTIDCCCGSEGVPMLPGPADQDPEFLRHIIQETVVGLAEEGGAVQVDTQRIYLTGLSNGCITSLSTAALHSDMIAAVACHAGSVLTPVADNYEGVPTLLIHGTGDGSLLYEGNVFGPGIGLQSVQSGVEYLAGWNGCGDSFEVQDFQNGTGTFASTVGCEAPVQLLTLFDVGHVPYLDFPPLESDLPGTIATVVDTTAMAWDFLSSFQKEEIPDIFQSTGSPTASPTEGFSAAGTVERFLGVLVAALLVLPINPM